MTADYEEHTRQRYRDQNVARDYAVHQRLWRSPVNWAIGKMETRAVMRAATPFLAGSPAMLDAPAGSGKLVRPLQRVSGLYVAGDISEAMLAHIPTPCTRAVMDAGRLPFPANSFDVVVCLRLVHRVPLDVLEEILREGLRVATRCLVFSYSGVPRYRWLHRGLRLAARRPASPSLTALVPDEVRAIASRLDTSVERDLSIAPALSSERVAVLLPT